MTAGADQAAHAIADRVLRWSKVKRSGAEVLRFLLVDLRVLATRYEEARERGESISAGMLAAKERGDPIGRRRVAVDVERARELIAQGKTARAAAAEMGIGYGTLQRALAAAPAPLEAQPAQKAPKATSTTPPRLCSCPAPDEREDGTCGDCGDKLHLVDDDEDAGEEPAGLDPPRAVEVRPARAARPRARRTSPASSSPPSPLAAAGDPCQCGHTRARHVANAGGCMAAGKGPHGLCPCQVFTPAEAPPAQRAEEPALVHLAMQLLTALFPGHRPWGLVELFAEPSLKGIPEGTIRIALRKLDETGFLRGTPDGQLVRADAPGAPKSGQRPTRRAPDPAEVPEEVRNAFVVTVDAAGGVLHLGCRGCGKSWTKQAMDRGDVAHLLEHAAYHQEPAKPKKAKGARL